MELYHLDHDLYEIYPTLRDDIFYSDRTSWLEF